MAPYKEPHFFVQPGDGLPTVDDRIGGLKEYEQLFDTTLSVRGEASTSYSHYPARRGVPERINERVPEARFIYLVRDPIDRLVSHYLHQVAYEGERQPLDQAIGDICAPDNVYICASRYAMQIERYLKVFPEETMLIVDHDDLLHARLPTLREIFDFLGVEPVHTSPDYDRRFNATTERRRYGYMYARIRGRAPLQRLPASLRTRVRGIIERSEKVLWRPLDAPTVPDALRAALSEVFTDDVKQLRTLSGKAFAKWSL